LPVPPRLLHRALGGPRYHRVFKHNDAGEPLFNRVLLLNFVPEFLANVGPLDPDQFRGGRNGATLYRCWETDNDDVRRDFIEPGMKPREVGARLSDRSERRVNWFWTEFLDVRQRIWTGHEFRNGGGGLHSRRDPGVCGIVEEAVARGLR